IEVAPNQWWDGGSVRGGPRPAAGAGAVEGVALQRHGVPGLGQRPADWRGPRGDGDGDHPRSVLRPLGSGALLVYGDHPGRAVAPPRLARTEGGKDARRILGLDQDLPANPPQRPREESRQDAL